MAKVTDLASELSSPATGDKLHAVDVSDPTDDAAGTSKFWTVGGIGTYLASLAQTLTNKTLTSPVLTTPQINDTSADHQYVFAVNELTADRTVTLPLLTGNDTFAFNAFTATLTNKTIDSASNTLTLDLGEGTLTGTIAEFQTAVQDATLLTTADEGSGNGIDADTVDGVEAAAFATLVGSETLTNKTLTAPALNGALSGDALSSSSTVNTGTAADEIVTPDALAGSYAGTKTLQMVVFDFTTNTATGDGKFYLHIPAALNGMDLIEVHAEVITAGTTGTTDIQIHNLTDAADMLSTKLTIDSGETGSDTAATPAVINTGADDVATNDVLRVDVDAVSTTPAQGLIVTLGFRLP